MLFLPVSLYLHISAFKNYLCQKQGLQTRDYPIQTKNDKFHINESKKK